MRRPRNAVKERHILEGNGTRRRDKLRDGDVIAAQFLQGRGAKDPTRAEAILVGDGAGVKRIAVPLAAFRAPMPVTAHEVQSRSGKKKATVKETSVVFLDVKPGNCFTDPPATWGGGDYFSLGASDRNGVPKLILDFDDLLIATATGSAMEIPEHLSLPRPPQPKLEAGLTRSRQSLTSSRNLSRPP